MVESAPRLSANVIADPAITEKNESANLSINMHDAKKRILWLALRILSMQTGDKKILHSLVEERNNLPNGASVI